MHRSGAALAYGRRRLRRVEGLTLKATDTDWSHGSGPLVEGPAVALMLATTGRQVALADLHGPGVETLRPR